ncbi:hypothetical protein AHIS1636_00570 [Arthrobacter mangrovi]|uniref:Uncharacterized protein n=1 Tax=Arthrobacter mangrovi TaxID=2966350 RepID=A0ABQ5MNT3_9MICC|nr:hypothetical protein AHIS1636_00570 [Arthrobacter mangrovi]
MGPKRGQFSPAAALPRHPGPCTLTRSPAPRPLRPDPEPGTPAAAPTRRSHPGSRPRPSPERKEPAATRRFHPQEAVTALPKASLTPNCPRLKRATGIAAGQGLA